jgi:hypothetical protein
MLLITLDIISEPQKYLSCWVGVCGQRKTADGCCKTLGFGSFAPLLDPHSLLNGDYSHRCSKSLEVTSYHSRLASDELEIFVEREVDCE